MKIAIIGGGISGLASGWLLNGQHDITLFEKNNYLGGHANTAIIKYPTKEGEQEISVDTGFIVYNEKTYHHLTPLFKELGVAVEKSIMSFGISDSKTNFEYASSGLFAQKRNLFKLSFHRMVYDIIRFNKVAREFIHSDEKHTLGELVDKMKFGEHFKRYYLFPMGAAIWSCPIGMIQKYPATAFLRFFANHGLLQVTRQPQWYSVKKGSKEYVKKITSPFKDKIHKNCAIEKVTNFGNKVELLDSKGKKYKFDKVIIATHGDQALKMLEQSTEQEKEILGCFKYSKNKAILHRDIKQMPKHKRAWASWNYLCGKDGQLSLTYWMNNLQNIDKKLPLFVTLNPYKEIAKDKIFGIYEYEHPIFDHDALKAQKEIYQIQGVRNIYYAGAHLRYGFHEDGLLSAINIANQLGVKAPWQKTGS